MNELESLAVVVGGAPSRFATGEEAAAAAAVEVADLVIQRPLLLLRRTVLAARVPSGTLGDSGTRTAATARWWLTLRIACGVVRADAESARKSKARYLLIEGMVNEGMGVDEDDGIK